MTSGDSLRAPATHGEWWCSRGAGRSRSGWRHRGPSAQSTGMPRPRPARHRSRRPKFQTGTRWMHLPERYGNWRGVCNRLRMWAVDGTWERVFTVLVAYADADEDVSWAVSVNSANVRAHHHAAGARKKVPGRSAGRSRHRPAPRGGLTTKIHLATDGRRRPLAFHLTAGQAGDAPAFTDVIGRLSFPRGRGRPRTRPDAVLADKAYSGLVPEGWTPVRVGRRPSGRREPRRSGGRCGASRVWVPR
ncbi:IS5 family transposase [Streptomyces sp. NRRL S-31]|uniref:IS5 family transposase n=1 Tax=Streptomyces sp. NRRL S-31 TaxID=1463898 RepID=UPI0009A0F83D